MTIAVADTTPLIVLSRLGLLDQLPDFLGDVYVTSGVVQESTMNKTLPGAIASALDKGIIKVSDEFDRTIADSLLLDHGESEAIALALAYQCPLLIDEKKGRRIAQQQGLTIFGTGTVLVMAKKQGIVESVAPLLQQWGFI